MLLELLSDFQISIPELGRIEARTQPVVLLTSNNTRELTEALKRRCLYLWLDYPELEHELEIVRLHSPELDEHVARKLVEVVHLIRELDLKKPPSIAESIDWARTLLLLGANDIDRGTFEQTMSVIVKHRTDLDTRRRAGRREARARAGRCRLTGSHPRADAGIPEPPEGFAGQLLGVRRGPARGGRRGRDLGDPRRLRRRSSTSPGRSRRTSARRSRRRSPSPRRTGACSSWSSTASSSAPPRPRRPGGGSPREASRGGEGERARPRRRCASRSPRRSGTARTARCATSRGWRSRPSAQGRGLRRARRRRAADPPRPRPAHRAAARPARGRSAPRRHPPRSAAALRGAPAPRARARR